MGPLRGLYTAAMLAAAVGAPIAAIRSWERRGYLRPTATRGRLAYFDFGEATVARRLAELLAALPTPAAVDRLVDGLTQAFPEVERPLLTMPLVVDEGRLFLRSGETLAEPGGQRLIDFDASAAEEDAEEASILSFRVSQADEQDPRLRAIELHDDGTVAEAIETLRLAMLQSGVTSEDHFTLGEWLYEIGQIDAARERFYAALELDSDHVEATLNLACVLAESGQSELAVAAFRGALEGNPLYADAHFHLAMTLERLGDLEAAAEHFGAFLEIAPESPWADEARLRLESAPGR